MLLMFTLVIIGAYLLPLLYMVTTAFQQPGQSTTPGAPVWPAAPQTAEYQGQPYPVYTVPFPDGTTRQLILIEPGRESSVFVDPTAPDPTPIEWAGPLADARAGVDVRAAGRELHAPPGTSSNFPRLLRNTFGIAILSTIGAVLSSILVAYGFARFRFPGKNAMFVVLIATIILPFQVTLLPQYVLFTWLGWNGTWLPLIIPHFFANAYNVFLLRQYFLTIPRELDEAAMIDGAGPFRILRSIIVPQSVAAIVAVSLFHFFFAWNDFFVPLLYLAQQAGAAAAVDRDPAVQRPVRGAADAHPGGRRCMTMAVPIVVFLLAQRAFMRGVVVTGVDK